ncbi:MAG: type II secretion system F family protein [Verrucomicrobiae bacterium]|nr:type II secretion system F family protein [Verrucomicrobiae bacterium]
MVFTPVVASDLKARAFLYSELAKFAGAGFGIDKACESIISQSGPDRVARSLCQAMLDGVRSGTSLAEGLARSSYPVSELEFSMVDAAEKGGQLEIGFRHLAEHFRQETEARRRIRRALVYPIVLLHFALLVGIGITTMFRTLGAGLTGKGSDNWRENLVPSLVWVAIGYLVAIGLILVWRSLSKAAMHSASIDALIQRVPFAGPVRRARGLARFCEVLHIYLLSGQRMNEAWRQAGEASQSGQLKSYAIRSSERLKAGESVGDVVVSAGSAMPGDLVRGLGSADLAGALDRETAEWAKFYREETAENVERLAEWAPKFFYWFVLGIAAWMIIRAVLSYGQVIQDMLNWGG